MLPHRLLKITGRRKLIVLTARLYLSNTEAYIPASQIKQLPIIAQIQIIISYGQAPRLYRQIEATFYSTRTRQI